MWRKYLPAVLIVVLLTPVFMFLFSFLAVAIAACATWDDVPFQECEFLLEGDDGNQCHEVVSPEMSDNVPEEWASIFSEAANEFNVNPNFIAAIYLSENGNEWKPLDSDWATSSAGATGPMQFVPGTWDEYGVDGDGDGNADVNDPTDAIHSAASMFSAAPEKGPAIYGSTTPDMQAGSIARPWAPGTLLHASVLYNAGPGTIPKYTSPEDSLDDPSPEDVTNPGENEWGRAWEAQRYLHNINGLLTSDLAKTGVTPENGYTGEDGGRQTDTGSYVPQYRDPHGMGVGEDGGDGDGESDGESESGGNSDPCGQPQGDLGAVVEVAWQEYERGADESPCDVVCDEYIGGGLEAWCADFVSWVFREAGIPFQSTPSTDSYFWRHDWQMPAVVGMEAWFKEGAHGSEFFTPDEKDPQPGDVAIYAGHVNIVVAVDPENETLETIGGNESNAIQHYPGTFSAGTSDGLVGYGRVNAEAADDGDGDG